MTPRQHKRRKRLTLRSSGQLAPLACSQPCGLPRPNLMDGHQREQRAHTGAREAASACNCWTLLQEEFQEEEYQGFAAREGSI